MNGEEKGIHSEQSFMRPLKRKRAERAKPRINVLETLRSREVQSIRQSSSPSALQMMINGCFLMHAMNSGMI